MGIFAGHDYKATKNCGRTCQEIPSGMNSARSSAAKNSGKSTITLEGKMIPPTNNGYAAKRPVEPHTLPG